MSTSRTFLRIVLGVALVGFLVGLGVAAWDIFAGESVREFQARGESSPMAERLGSLAHRAAIEAVGFLAVGLFLGATSLAAAALLGRGDGTRGERVGAGLLFSAVAFYAWATTGAWLGNEALPFLGTGSLWTLNAVGFTAILLGLVACHWIARLLPWSGEPRPLALAFAVVVCVGLGAWYGLTLVKAAEDSHAIGTLALGAAPGAVGLAVSGLAARVLQPLAGALVAWWSRPTPVPKKAVWAVGAVALLCVGVVAPKFSLHSVSGPMRYKTLANPETPAGPNVVLITIDTLRAQSLGCYGYERPTSPFLDSVAANGTVMLDATASAAWTKPTTGTILTGLYPSRHGALEHGSPLRTPEGTLTLAETFRDAGYVTAGFVTNPNIKAVFDFDRGFDEYFDSPVEDTVTLASIRNSLFGKWLMNLARYQFNWKYENDVMRMNEYIFPWLEKNAKSRFFLYLHYIDPHSPYSPPDEYYEIFRRDAGTALFNERKKIVGLDLYDGEIRYTDDGMEDLVEKLQELGLWENTVFVLTADHGEEWFEHEVLGHGFSLYQPVVGVPLIFHGPGVPAGRRVETPVQIVDMPATVLDLARTGQTAIGDGTSFRELFAAEGPERLLHLENEFDIEQALSRSFVFKGLRKGPYKLVLTEANKYFPPSDPRYKDNAKALYDVVKDPGEQQNLFHDPQYEPVIKEMLDSLLTHQKFLSEHGLRGAGEVEMDAGVMAELQALGYLGNN